MILLGYNILRFNSVSVSEEVSDMKVSYNKLWKILIDKKMSKSKLRDAVNMSSNTLAKMGKEETISMEVIMRICKVLQCDIGDIMEIIPTEGHDYNHEA